MIILREYCENDLEDLVTLANNDKVSRYLDLSFPHPYTHEAAAWWIEIGCRAEGSAVKVIEWEGQFVGSVGTTAASGWRSHIAEIGYWLGEPFWGKGIASQALDQMTKIAFTELEFQKLQASVLKPNVGSMKVLEKCGYILEGEMAREVCRDGIFYDTSVYSKLKPLP